MTHISPDKSLSHRLRALCVGAVFSLPLVAGAEPGWIGTYTDNKQGRTGSAGIYSFEWDANAGTLTGLAPVAIATNPSFVVLHPNGRFLYAVNEEASAIGSDHVTVFAIDAQQRRAPLRVLESVASRGSAPCHLAVDPSGHWLFVANYSSGTVAVYRIEADGLLSFAQRIQQRGTGPVAGRQDSAHAHQVVLSPDGRFLLSTDLGADRIFVYRFNKRTGALVANRPPSLALPAGSGPRHLVFSPDARRVYVVTELDPKLITLGWNSRSGALTPVAATATLPPGFDGTRSAAEIVMHPSGRFLFVSNRASSNTVAIFRIDAKGVPVPAGHVATGGSNPRFMTLDPSGRFLLVANQDSSDIHVFGVDASTGGLTATGEKVSVPVPVAIAIESSPR